MFPANPGQLLCGADTGFITVGSNWWSEGGAIGGGLVVQELELKQIILTMQRKLPLGGNTTETGA